MSQVIFKDPIVSVAAVGAGTGNGTCTIDRLTHFTIAQVYTLTCIAKSPDTLFTVVGSLDGPVGIATVGTQFFDEELKVFLTLQQGSTVYEVGDTFVFTVANGTDLDQANIDTYDELPQKNFGVGTLGVFKGDHNLRYSDTSLASYLYLQDLKFTAVTAGSGSDAVTVAYTTGATAGAEVVSVSSNAISVQIESGVSTATQVKAALDAYGAAAALITTTIIGAGSNPQVGAVTARNLAGGRNKNYALNHNEFTDSGNFAEGNANVRVRDATLRGALDVTGHAHLRSVLSLNDADSTNSSGNAVANVQQFMNSLDLLNKIQISTVGNAFMTWAAPSLSCSANIEIYFRDSAIKNTISMASPISISDGQSVYCTLNPNSNVTISTVVGTSLSALVTAFRLVTRVGNYLIWYNGTVQNDAEQSRIGNAGSSSTSTANAIMRRDSSSDFAAHNATLNKALVAPGSGNGLDVSSAGALEIGVSAGANNITIGGSSSTVIIAGDLIVQGNTVTLNVATLDVEDKNIKVNLNGSDATSEGAGLTVARTGTSGSLIYAAAATSKFKIGALGSEIEVADISSTQTFTNKTLSGNTAATLISGSGTFTFNTSGTLTAPNATDTLVGKATTDVLTNKTLTGNIAANLVSSTGTFVLNTSGTITVPSATDTLVGKATTDTLTNKTLTGNTAANLISGSGTLVLNTTGTVTVPNTTDTLVGKATTDTLTNKTLTGNTAVNLISGSGTLVLNTTGTMTLPNATDTVVGKATTDVLTNKTLSGNTAVTLISGSGTLTLNTTGTVTLPNATDTLMGKATTDTATNKTLAVGSNHITGTLARVPQFNASTGDLEASAITNTQLSYLDATSSIQTQINTKAASANFRVGSAALTLADTSKAVSFSSTIGTTGYRVTCQLVNVTDSAVQVQPVTVTAKSATGFTATWPGGVDSSNYVLEYLAIIDV